MDPRKCCTVIAQLLHLQNTGQYLSGVEATDVFFGVTKLFMSDDASLRRMVYLFIKDVAETCDPDDVIIVTSCLSKDMTCDVDLYRANALRVLVRIVDESCWERLNGTSSKPWWIRRGKLPVLLSCRRRTCFLPLQSVRQSFVGGSVKLPKRRAVTMKWYSSMRCSCCICCHLRSVVKTSSCKT
jgi:hypothetical protein